MPEKKKEKYSLEKDIEYLQTRRKKAAEKLKPKKKEPEKKEETWVDRLKKKVKKYFAGEKKKEPKAARTKLTKEQLKKHGLTDADIKKLRGEK